VTRTRAVHHAGVAWAAAVAGAWLVAASCRSMRDAPLLAADTPIPLPETAQPVAPRAIRVGVLVSSEQATITAANGVVVRGTAAGETVALVRTLERATFRAVAPGGRLRLLETGDELDRALVQPADAADLLHADATPYRGVLEVLPAEEGRLTVVNVVPLEDYLRGVVPNELAPEAFPQIEALKAQAVAARSYVLAHLGDYASRGYDVCATAACQVYRGSASEHPLTDRAVLETRGLVATWRGRPIHAFYTSTCGGHTEEGTAVFEDGAPYLRGVACPTERTLAGDETARGGDWEVRLTPAQVGRAVARYGDVGAVQDLLPTKLGVSGRVVELSVVGSGGQLDLRGMHVRQGLGLRESLFVIHRETGAAGEIEHFVINGKGWGHGVGLCQVGAFGMAQAGSSFEAILKHYYTGISVQPLPFFDTRRSPS
jgi:stage II sporulation protein D